MASQIVEDAQMSQQGMDGGGAAVLCAVGGIVAAVVSGSVAVLVPAAVLVIVVGWMAAAYSGGD